MCNPRLVFSAFGLASGYCRPSPDELPAADAKRWPTIGDGSMRARVSDDKRGLTYALDGCSANASGNVEIIWTGTLSMAVDAGISKGVGGTIPDSNAGIMSMHGLVKDTFALT